MIIVVDKRLFLVVKQDTVLQATGYFVFAEDQDKAKALVDKGFYIEETATTQLDLLETETTSITEINQEQFGGIGNEGSRDQGTSSRLHGVSSRRERN
jgi:hypothetical protein